ncbi:hypothetical protein [Virgisporangium aurantiacum]|uniref:Uncharacterized protein n=1 Tax=Virgisporangium aurantiacum TaxID=175570 RepID=A0A8J3Z414_9ACTN|nr:hypothetical protein [Virgisporangium aurantiacum]GIJ55908.1 hypothetical protein Vau01_034240 [Virgisporangium aurantiacum]
MSQRILRELREVSALLAERSAGIRYGWWTGRTDDPDFVAAARRVKDDLATAAHALGPEMPRPVWVNLGVFAVAHALFIGVLVAVTDPGRPLVILAAVGAFVGVYDLASWWSMRRAAARPVPAAHDVDVSELRARLTGVLDRLDRDNDKAARTAAVEIERALMWIEDE